MRLRTSPTRRWAVVGLAVAVLVLPGCAKKSPTGQGALGGNPTSASPPPTVTAPATTPPRTVTPPHTTGPAGAQIVQFDVKQQPACPVVGTSAAPFSQAGIDIILEWEVTGATGIALSVDDPTFYSKNHAGSFSNYPSTGTADIAFQCDPTKQPNTTHTYSLNTMGGGGPSVEKTLTVTVPTTP